MIVIRVTAEHELPVSVHDATTILWSSDQILPDLKGFLPAVWELILVFHCGRWSRRHGNTLPASFVFRQLIKTNYIVSPRAGGAKPEYGVREGTKYF